MKPSRTTTRAPSLAELERLEHVLDALAGVLAAPEDAAAIAATLRAHLGHGWSIITTAQYLTGAKAALALSAWLPQQAVEDRARAEVIVELAHQLCAHGADNAAWSGAKRVWQLRQRYGATRSE